MKLDGFLARRYNMTSVLGTILDPAADKALMTTLTITLTMQELIPRKSHDSNRDSPADYKWNFQVPLTVIILGRDFLLSLSAFYIRYLTLPHPVRPCYTHFVGNSNMTENLFTVLGFLITFGGSTADIYKQGLFLFLGIRTSTPLN